ncbi:MAG: transcription termination factor Rho [bacterium]|nr:transcription termination factor Rho [bacterium]
MPEKACGILKRVGKGAGLLYDVSSRTPLASGAVQVPVALMQKYRLVEGAVVAGPVRQGKRGSELASVDSVSGLAPEAFQKRIPYTKLTAIHPSERFNLARGGETSMRIVDLVAPIGKGTRGLIVSPPKAGKTVMLEHIAKAIAVDDPEARVIALLVDERPEEVTHFSRAVTAEVFASSSDQSVREHVALTELILAHMRAELECGRDVVVLVDSLTRMGRAFNLRGKGTGRTLSGGMGAGALEIPRRFFGSARSVEEGGSITIIATALIETGSRMDDVIFEEFKGTGNSEIILDRSLAEAHIFPAINIPGSSTRREEDLYGPEDGRRIVKLRRWLANRRPQEAMKLLLELLEKHPTNEELLASIPADGEGEG